MIKFGHEISHEDVEHAMRMHDLAHDGSLSKDEFKALLLGVTQMDWDHSHSTAHTEEAKGGEFDLKVWNISKLPQHLKKLLPELEITAHKGMNGKVGVLGGSKEYTGAPYYAAISSLRAGSDLSHIFTPDEDALIPMKCYSPEIIVHPANTPSDLINWMHALYSLVIGPGLGRSEHLFEYLNQIIRHMSSSQCKVKLIGDADFLFHLCTKSNAPCD